MKLEEIHYDITEEKIEYLSYTFKINETETEKIREETKKAIEGLEKTVEQTYQGQEFEKTPTTKFRKNEIQAGYKYEQKNKTGINSDLSAKLTYALRTFAEQAEAKVELFITGEKDNLILKLYDEIKRNPALTTTKEVENNMKDFEYITRGKYKDIQYPGLINQK